MELMEKSISCKNGYKKTELGIIPTDWILTTIGTLVNDSIIEKPLDGNHGNIHPKKSDFVEDGIPFIMANDIHDGKIDLKRCNFITKKQADSLQKGFSKKGDVLLTHKGTVGNVALVDNIDTPYIMLTPQVTYYRVLDTKTLDNKYLKFFFESSSFQNNLKNFSGGGTRAYIGIIKQKELSIILPPTLHEQRAIAAALSEVDALIQSLEELIRKKRAVKQGAMQELLTGRRRLDGFSGEWEEKRIEEVGTVIRGASPRPKGDPRYYGGHIPRLMVEDITRDGKYVTPCVDYLTEEGAQKSRPCAKGTLTIVCSGTVGIPSILKIDACIHDGFLAIVNLKKNVEIEYLFYLLSTLREKFDQSATHGGVFTNLTTKILREFQTLLPPTKDEQCAIAQLLSDMDAEIEALEQKQAKYRSIKQGMMQELLTGKTRLV